MQRAVRFGLVLQRDDLASKEVLEQVVFLAENTLFDSLWMVDHMGPSPFQKNTVGRAPPEYDAWVTLGVVACVSRRLNLCVGVSDPHRYHPAILAHKICTLDHYSNGRAILGLGSGEAMNLFPFGIDWSRPRSKLGEAIFVIKRLMREERVDFEGNFFKLRGATLTLRPKQAPHPPIFVGSAGTGILEIVGRLADGWVPIGMSSRLYTEDLKVVNDWAKKEGREGSVEPALWTRAGMAKDYNHAFEKYGEWCKHLLLMLPRRLRRMGHPAPTTRFDLERIVPDPRISEELSELAKALPDELLKDIFVLGSPDDCIGSIEGFLRAGVRHLVFGFPGRLEERLEAYRRFSEKVLSYFRSPHDRCLHI